MLKLGFVVLLASFLFLENESFRLNDRYITWTSQRSRLCMQSTESLEERRIPSFGKWTTSVILAGTMLTTTFSPLASIFSQPSHLIVQAKSLSNLQQASILFQKSDDARKLTEKQYVKTEEELKKANQLLEKTILAKYKNILTKFNNYEKEFTNILNKYNKLVADEDTLLTTKYQTEINELETLVESKYTIAENALQKLNEIKNTKETKDPSNQLLVTSDLFNKAKTEASKLEENKKQYQLLLENLQYNTKLNHQLNDYFVKSSQHFHQLIHELTRLLETNKNEYYNFNNGIGINENICRYQLNDCILHGKEGLSSVKGAIEKYQENENEMLKYITTLENELRYYGDLKKDLIQTVTSRFNGQVQAITNWETENKLTLTKNKPSITRYQTELITILNSLEKKFESYSHDIQFAFASSNGIPENNKKNTNNGNSNSNNNNNNNNIVSTMSSVTKQSYDTAIKSMKIVLENLEIADKTSKTAEKLLLDAKEQGDKEAAVYLKTKNLYGSNSNTNSLSGSSVNSKEVKVTSKKAVLEDRSAASSVADTAASKKTAPVATGK